MAGARVEFVIDRAHLKERFELRVAVAALSTLRFAARSDRLMLAVDKVMKPFNPVNPERLSNPYPLYERALDLGRSGRHLGADAGRRSPRAGFL